MAGRLVVQSRCRSGTCRSSWMSLKSSCSRESRPGDAMAASTMRIARLALGGVRLWYF